MAGTIKIGMALVLVCTVVITVNCRSLYSPNVDQLSADEMDSPRVRRNPQGGPGAETNKSFPVRPKTRENTTPLGERYQGPEKVLCDRVVVKKNDRTRCADPSVEVKWSPVKDGAQIWVYNVEINEVES